MSESAPHDENVHHADFAEHNTNILENAQTNTPSHDLEKEKRILHSSHTTSINIGYVAGLGMGNPSFEGDDGNTYFDC